MRGEYCWSLKSSRVPVGSPPLAWGIQHGKDWVKEKIKDHPHLRGEYSTGGGTSQSCSGSPPLAWGIRKVNKISNPNLRITPTCVGNTESVEFFNFSTEDHPHLRGEYTITAQTIGLSMGSPPLAWGIQDFCRLFESHAGITPTCVGNTERHCHTLQSMRDHPHLRGEYRQPGSH